jgi:hypothetical protein
VICHRRWPDPPANSTAAPELRSAVNNRSWEPKFHPLKDEYLCCFFRSAETGITSDNLYVEVDGFGTQALIVTADGSGGWQANCLKPPGLEPGPHEVRVRTVSSARSDAVTITMLDEFGRDEAQSRSELSLSELTAAAPELVSAEFKSSGDLRLAGSQGGSLVCYFRSPAKSISPRDVVIELSGRTAPVQAVSMLEPGVWQANANLTQALPLNASARLHLGNEAWSNVQLVAGLD